MIHQPGKLSATTFLHVMKKAIFDLLNDSIRKKDNKSS